MKIPKKVLLLSITLVSLLADSLIRSAQELTVPVEELVIANYASTYIGVESSILDQDFCTLVQTLKNECPNDIFETAEIKFIRLQQGIDKEISISPAHIPEIQRISICKVLYDFTVVTNEKNLTTHFCTTQDISTTEAQSIIPKKVQRREQFFKDIFAQTSIEEFEPKAKNAKNTLVALVNSLPEDQLKEIIVRVNSNIERLSQSKRDGIITKGSRTIKMQ